MFNPTYVEAILSLEPNAKFVISNNSLGSMDWQDESITRPSDEDIETELKKLQDTYVAQEYARNRKAEYDALNQFEMQYDDEVNGTTTWKDAIEAIKAKWPKDNSGPI